jgi:hypothetical protein
MLIWSGLTGARVTDVLRSLVSGKKPPGPDPKLGITASFDASAASAAGGGGSTATPNAAGLVNPIGHGLVRGRTDMGVDFTGSGPLYAIGPGTITNIAGSGWPGGIYILLKLDNGQYVYYAEHITPAVSVGQRVKAGDLIGHALDGYPWIEIGWGTSTPQEAQAHGHYSEGVVTSEGQSFAALLTQLGAP